MARHQGYNSLQTDAAFENFQMSRNRGDGTLVLTFGELEGMARPPDDDDEACIILLHPPGPDIGRRTPLTNVCYVVGRDASADLVIPRSTISRQHSRLMKREGSGWWVEDLGSTNGTFVNESRVSEERRLADGDQIRFGDTIFKFLSGSNVEAAYHEEIYRMTIVDGLTGVYNKRYFLDFLEREMARSHRHGQPLSLVMFDIDHFKQINDNRGHLAGDAVLKELCARIKVRIRREDLFARYGGEEFAAILTSTPLDGGVSFAEHVRLLVAQQPFRFDNQVIPVTVSLGVASTAGESGLEPQELIRRADENLYAAKHGGRNQVVPSPREFGL